MSREENKIACRFNVHYYPHTVTKETYMPTKVRVVSSTPTATDTIICFNILNAKIRFFIIF